MRVNIRKLIIICGTLVLLWVVVSYSSIIVPTYKPRSSISILEGEINRLENKMQDQLSESNKLLEKVRMHLKKTEETHEKDSDKDAQMILNEIDIIQSKCLFYVFYIL